MRNKIMVVTGIILLMATIVLVYNTTNSKIGETRQTGKEVTQETEKNPLVVGTKEKLNDIFLTAIKREKKNRGFSFFGREKATEESLMNDAGSDATSQTYSETNVQVQGVDEADTVKTDGTYIYQVLDGRILITKAVPADKMELEGSIQYNSNFSPSQLFQYENNLVVIGHAYDEKMQSKNTSSNEAHILPSYFHSTKALVYDITNKKEPKQIREVEIEGSFVTARRMGEYIYLVANHYPDIWMLEEEEDLDLRPRYYDTAVSKEQQLIDYNQIQYVPESQETNYSIIASFNVKEPKTEASLTTYLGSGHQIYMSKQNLYLAVPNYKELSEFPREESFSPDTTIYKFSVQKDKVNFQSSGEVPGTILNQFSMDEYKGNFRVVTTKGDTWNEEKPSANNLYILDENLKRIGELENLARGERIYSARFMEDRIYVVTFKQVDPLFVIDASDSTKPTVLGELKIPGFSNYLHPYDENHLIGFGHDTKVVPNKEGGEPLVLMEGVKISLFDVSDVANPKEKFSEIIGGRGTYTPLNYDHKALLFHKEKNIFAFPISVYQGVKGNDYEQRFEFQGGYVYNLNLDSGFTLKKKITHIKGESNYDEWESNISRLLYIGDYIYSISPSKLTAHDLQHFDLKGEVRY